MAGLSPRWIKWLQALAPAVALVLLLAVDASAAMPRMPGGAVAQVDESARGGITLEQATRIVRAAYGGRVVSARPVQRGGDSGYQVRIVLEDGRVMNVFVDSQGRIR
jgi:uncharacterized membrane protein YkoI